MNGGDTKKFVIYRPGKPTNRLEGEHHVDLSKWAPSVHYGLTLEQIRKQLTPSEQHKLNIQTAGAEERRIKKLEARWRAAPLTWGRRTLQIQSWLRGVWSRRAFRKFKAQLMRERDIREARRTMVLAFEEGEPYKSLEILSQTDRPPIDMQVNACKILYRLREFAACEAQCKVVLKEYDEEHQDAQYILGSSLAARGRLDDAYEVLKTMINLTGPRADACKLSAYICMKLSPPKYDQARLNMDFLVEDDPSDMNVLLQRGCVCAHLQDWSACIDDFTMVLHYQPHLHNVRLLLARAFACAREWSFAAEEYEEVGPLHCYPQLS